MEGKKEEEKKEKKKDKKKGKNHEKKKEKKKEKNKKTIVRRRKQKKNEATEEIKNKNKLECSHLNLLSLIVLFCCLLSVLASYVFKPSFWTACRFDFLVAFFPEWQFVPFPPLVKAQLGTRSSLRFFCLSVVIVVLLLVVVVVVVFIFALWALYVCFFWVFSVSASLFVFLRSAMLNVYC